MSTSSAGQTAAVPWWEVEVEVPLRLADEASAALIANGAAGVEVVCLGIEAPTSPGRPPRRASRPEVALLIACYLDDEAGLEPPALSDRAAHALHPIAGEQNTALRGLHRRTDTEWTEQWKAFFVPRKIGERVWTVPQWEHDKGFATPPNAIRIVLDPGLAFGTGNHATTSLCLEVLQERLSEQCPETLLDVGAGTGILALAAHHLGVAKIMAIDIDADATKAATENLTRNNIPPGAIEVSDIAVDQLGRTFDFVVANILAHILIRIAPGVSARVKPRGTLLLSGIPVTESAAVKESYPGFELIEERTEGEWCALVMRRG